MSRLSGNYYNAASLMNLERSCNRFPRDQVDFSNDPVLDFIEAPYKEEFQVEFHFV